MQENSMYKFTSKIYQVCEWICRLAYINLLWILFTLAGLIVFGLLPATVAMFAVLRKWMMQETNIPVFETFIGTYKKDFIKINALGFIFFIIGYIIYFNYLFMQTTQGIIHMILLCSIFSTILIYIIVLIFIFPVYVHYELKFFEYIKVAFIIGILNPLEIIIFMLSFILLYYLFYFIPGLLPFLGSSIFGLIIMWRMSIVFLKIEKIEKERKRECN